MSETPMVYAAVRRKISGHYSLGKAMLPYPDPVSILARMGYQNSANAVICKLPAPLVEEHQKSGLMIVVGKSRSRVPAAKDDAVAEEVYSKFVPEDPRNVVPINVTAAEWNRALKQGVLKESQYLKVPKEAREIAPVLEKPTGRDNTKTPIPDAVPYTPPFNEAAARAEIEAQVRAEIAAEMAAAEVAE